MFVMASGDGCALLQVDVSYNIPSPDPMADFFIHVKQESLATAQGLQDGLVHRSMEGRYRVKSCVRWMKRGSSNMAVMEFNLLTGFRPDLESVHQLLQTQRLLKRYEVKDRTVFFYFDEIPSTCRTCVSFNTIQEFYVGRVQPQPVKIYDYYEPMYEGQFVYQPTLAQNMDICVNETSCESVDDIPSDSDYPSSLYNDEDDQQQEIGEEYEECHCNHNCGFEGPEVCGSDGNIYLNNCRMEAAACELNMVITKEEERSICFEDIYDETSSYNYLNDPLDTLIPTY
jgi:hypothetical protein